MDKDPKKTSFAADGDHAEKGPRAGGKGADGGPAPIVEEDEFRRDARIWSLYLKEAGEEVKDKAELLKTGLESLLLLAGLFAGVVSSFLVESRRNLVLDDQEALLMDIRNALRNEPPPLNTFEPSLKDLWINGLWFASLLITLFSAIMGVLARSWLVKFIPASTRQESRDAYQRWMLDRRSTRWRLEKVISIVPLLVQLAFFLFSLGLGIQVLGDHRTLGALVLSAVLFGSFVYGFITVLPLFLPPESSPFQTPLSEFLLDFQSLYRSIRNKTTSQPPSKGYHFDPHHVTRTLAKIWYTKLIQSPKPNHVDEAIAELTRKPLKEERIKFFAERETLKVSLRRLGDCMMPEAQDMPRRNEILSHHLQALSRFVSHSERRNHDHEALKGTLLESLKPGRPLQRWNFFPEPIRALAFSVRTPILLGLNQDISDAEVEEQPWQKMVLYMLPKHRRSFVLAACRGLVHGQANLAKVSGLAIGYCLANGFKSGTRSEWSSDTTPKQASAMALCRLYLTRLYDEIERGWKAGPLESVKTPVGEIRSTTGQPSSLASALSHTNSKIRQQGIATVTKFAEEADYFGDAIESSISKLIEMAVNDDDAEMRAAATQALRSLGSKDKLRKVLTEELLKLLQSELSDFGMEARTQALTMIHELANDVEVLEEVFMPSISKLIAVALFDSEESVQSSAVQLLERLVEEERIRVKVKETIWERLKTEIEDENWSNRYRAFKTISNIADSYTLRDVASFEENTGHLTPLIIQATVNDSDSDVRENARGALTAIVGYCPDEQRSSLLVHLKETLMEALSNEYWHIRLDAVKTLHKCYESSVFEDLVKDFIPKTLVLLCDNSDSDVWNAIFSLFETLADHETFCGPLKTALIKDIDVLLKALPWQRRINLITLLESLMTKGDQSSDGFSTIINVTIHDDDDDVRTTGVKALLTLSTLDNWQDTIMASLPEKIDLSPSGEEGPIAVYWLRTVVILTQTEMFREHCSHIIAHSIFDKTTGETEGTNEEEPSPIASDSHEKPENKEVPPKDTPYDILAKVARKFDDMNVRISALQALHFMMNDQGNKEAFATFHGMSDDLLSDPEWQIRQECVKLLATLNVGRSEFNDKLPTILERALSDPDSDVRRESVKALAVFAKEASGAEALIKAISASAKTIDAIPQDQGWVWRQSWVEILEALASHGEYMDALSRLVEISLKDGDRDVRFTAVKSLTSLANNDDAKLAEGILGKTTLPKNLDSVSNDNSWRVREAWAETLASLCKHAATFVEGPLRLIELTVRDEDSDVRMVAFNALTTLSGDSKLRETITSNLVKTFESALRDPMHEKRSCAIETLQTIGTSDSKFGDVIKALLSLLLKVASTDENGIVQEAAEELLINVIQNEAISDIEIPLLSVLSTSVASITDRGKIVALRLTKKMSNLPEDQISSITRTLTPLLKSTYGLTRATALELLAILYENRPPKSHSQWMQYMVSDVVMIALEDDNDNTRSMALNLLIKLCNDKVFLTQIKTAQPRLMPLLAVRPLQSPTIELISLLSQDIAVRNSVASWLVTSLISDTTSSSEVAIELLSSLIADGWLCNGTQGSDYILIFLASALVSGATLTEFHYRIATSLWTNYCGLPYKTSGGNSEADRNRTVGGNSPADEKKAEFPPELIEWLMFAVCGHHVTMDAANQWLEMDKYLG